MHEIRVADTSAASVLSLPKDWEWLNSYQQ